MVVKTHGRTHNHPYTSPLHTLTHPQELCVWDIPDQLCLQSCHRCQPLLPQPPSSFLLHPHNGTIFIGTNQVRPTPLPPRALAFSTLTLPTLSQSPSHDIILSFTLLFSSSSPLSSPPSLHPSSLHPPPFTPPPFPSSLPLPPSWVHWSHVVLTSSIILMVT